jgi:hypothetical protein
MESMIMTSNLQRRREIEQLIASTQQVPASEPSDYEESPQFVEREFGYTNTGEQSTYFDRSGQGHEVTFGRATSKVHNYYHDMELLISDPVQVIVRPVDCPQLIELNFRWHSTSQTQTTRNRLRYGTLHTRTQRIALWGFDSWTEFKSHIASTDWKLISPIRDELVADIALDRDFDGTRMGYWIAKDEQSQTRPGAWVISIDNPRSQLRSLVIGYQNQFQTKSPLKIKQQTAVSTKW